MSQAHPEDVLRLAALLAVECLDIEAATVSEATSCKEPILKLACTIRPILLPDETSLRKIWESFREDKSVTDATTYTLMSAAAVHQSRLIMMGIDVGGLIDSVVDSFAIATAARSVIDESIKDRAYTKSVDVVMKDNYWYVYLYMLQLGGKWVLQTSTGKRKP
jgi:hypothetical protein